MLDFWHDVRHRIPLRWVVLSGTTAVMLLAMWLALMTPPIANAEPLDPPLNPTATNNGPTVVNKPTRFFGAAASQTPIEYTWEFGDGTFGSGSDVTHTYTETGIYTATLYASNDDGPVTTTTTVYVGDVVITATVTNTFSPANVVVRPGSTVVWKRAGGTHSVTADDGSFNKPLADDWDAFIHTFAATSSTDAVQVRYYCTLHGNVGGSGMSGIVTLQEDQPIQAVSADNDSPGEIGDQINFTATITGGTNIEYEWDFGDGTQGSGITTSHVYTESGVYTAQVVASNLSNTVMATTTVYVGAVVIDVVNNKFLPPLANVPPGSTVIWEWKQGFHDVVSKAESPVQFEQPAGIGWPPFAQTFNSPAKIPYVCTIHSGMEGVINVEAPTQIGGLAATNDGPKEVGTAISLSATITSGASIDYEWDFGDGTTDINVAPKHTYAEAGIYTATVTASNEINTVVATTTVYVGDAIVDVGDNFYAPKDVAIDPGDIVIWVLKEGFHSVTADDGSFNQPASNNFPPFVHTFPEASDFAAAAVIGYHCTVHGGPGGVGMAGTVTISEPPPPVAGLTATNNGPKEVGDPIGFTAVVTGGTGISYTWSFGDGGTATGNAPSHTYNESGVFTATVAAINATNSVTATTTVFVGDAVVQATPSNAFVQPNVTVPLGGTVIWVNTGGTHSVTEDDGRFNRPAASSWPPFVQTFNTADVYNYFCTVHGGPGRVGMSGRVTVEQRSLLMPNIFGNAPTD